MVTNQTWDCNGGVLLSVEDPNSQTTSYSYDSMWRLIGTAYPDGGQVTTSYTPTEVTTTTAVRSGTNRVDEVMLDGLGRTLQSILVNDPDGETYVATSYDSLGRVASVTNPYRGSPSGSTLYSYDPLNRPTVITRPDSNEVITDYSVPNCAKTTDEAGKVRTICADALGRVTSATEDPTGLNYQTTYSYDPLGNLKGVTQGSETRSYAYDYLSRLTQSTTPEANNGTRYFYYTASGGALCSGDPNSLCQRTDERGVTTTYSYSQDALNFLVSKSYSDGVTPTANFSYGESRVTLGTWTSPTLLYPLGRLTHTTTVSGSTVQTATVQDYDKMGRTQYFWQCTTSAGCGGANVWQMSYNYDLAGDVQSWAHPGQFTLTNTVSAAQRITAVTSSLTGTNFPQTLAENITYTPWGAVSQIENGCAGSGCANTLETYSYNDRLQTTQIQLSGSPSGGYTLAYNYYLPGTTPTGCPVAASGSGDNGNVIGYTYTDTVNNYAMRHSALYVYDTVNRLVCAQATSPNNNPAATYNLAFSYDRYGNMACVQNSYTNGYCPQWAYNAGTNRLSGSPYDTSGDLLTDPSTNHTWQWDGEGRVASADSGPTWGFTYNALGDRAQWTYTGGADQHIFDAEGNWLGVYGGYDLVRLTDRLFVVYTGSETYFNHINNLDSTVMMTNHAGTSVEDVSFDPWGQLWQSSGSGGYTFAGLPYYDTKTDTSFTASRVYSPNLGRWLSPDSVRGDVTNPQTLNLYPYVTDNPTTLTDPSGLCGCGGGGFGFGEGGGGWGGGCGGGGFGGGFGGRGGGPPPPPPTIPIPGPVTTSIAGGGLFSDAFSFASIQDSPPLIVYIVGAMPLPPSSSDTGKCTACTAPFAQGGNTPGAGNLCESPEPYLIRSFQCTGGQGTNKPGGCCYIEQGKFQASCQAHGGHMVSPNSATFSYAVCCSKTPNQNPAPGQPPPAPWYPPAC